MARARVTVAPIANRDEVLALLTRAAREGNVGAMRALLEELKRDGGSQSATSSVIDELATQRAKAAAKETR
jgi:hypothetical protein